MNEEKVQDLDSWRKKLIFRAWHRGTREMDLIIGRFAEAYVPSFGGEQLARFEELMKENDPDVYDWIIGRAPPPERCQHDVMQQLCSFYKLA